MNRILYITNQICGSGGLERVLSIKASYLAEHLGYEVHILTLNQGEEPLFYDFSEKLKYHDISVGGNPLSYIKAYANGINKVIDKVDPNIILVCDDGLKAFFLPALIKNKCPKIYERHVSKNIAVQSDSLGFFKKKLVSFKYFLMNKLAKKYDRFVVLTEGNLNDWNLNNLKVIPNPLSFYPEEESTSSLQNNKVLAVGKQCYQKGYDRLLHSWKNVSEKHPDWKLEIYGKMDPDQELFAMASDLNIEDSVSFFPPTKTIQKQYEEAAIYVMSSRYEGFGMVLIEAMAYGVPCVSFDCPFGPSDIITHGKDGYLVENGDVIALAQSINSLIENDSLRKDMGLQARKSIKKYLPEKVCKEWDDLFQSLINTSV
ncbi:glycosyltransferase family 4 protein [Aquimarina gracilis]|uniref:Glycosyltransferase family 4 protein n=1 Tax=Aquimarina gracilis TaxID=874422 RepID=A0ABU6A205_9FLAO|nr:glycosyltransferase family 4 protein [Aquimarina gracilis]MEB3348188.1 glycosyltransferase family 4 protein [Aquimarina gracilis]